MSRHLDAIRDGVCFQMGVLRHFKLLFFEHVFGRGRLVLDVASTASFREDLQVDAGAVKVGVRDTLTGTWVRW